MSIALSALRMVWSAGWDLAFAGVFLAAWVAPHAVGETLPGHLVFVMILEFLLVHATGFFGAVGAMGTAGGAAAGRRRRALAFTGLFAMYGVIVGGFSLALGSAWPFLAFAFLLLPRFPGIVLDPPDFEGQLRVMGQWAATTALFVVGVFISLIGRLPPLGITPEIVALQGFTAEGLWFEEPHRVMVFGVFYFTGNAVVSLLMDGYTLRQAVRAGRGDETGQSRS